MAVLPPSHQHLSVLQDVFGLPSFRGRQYEAITATLTGKDSCVVLPTGAGKSLAFQFPPHALDRAFTVVIGPLIALMKDQVEKCLEKGIDAAVFNSQCQEVQKECLLRDMTSFEPSVKLIYTTPESLQQPRFREALLEASQQGSLLAFAIDEAHCISEWGTSFRPAYLSLTSLKTDFPNTPITALTASCTPIVQKSIISLLKLRDPVIIKSSFNRPNIQYLIRYKELLGAGTDDDVVQDLVQFIQSRPEDCGIIYARTRAACDWLSKTLQDLDMDVGCYHAGRDASSRARVQREWSEGCINVVVATIAFGMGIDRADVRWVVHWNCPTSMEGFYQESGRAGRDGLPSMAVVYASRCDVEAAVRMERGGAAGGAGQLGLMCMTACCRRRKVLEYFSETSGPCTDLPDSVRCDFCADPACVRRALAALDKRQQASNLAAAVRARQAASDGDDAAGAQQEEQEEEEEDGAAGPGPASKQRSHQHQLQGGRGWWGTAGALLQSESGTSVRGVQAAGSNCTPCVGPGADTSSVAVPLQRPWSQVGYPPQPADARQATAVAQGARPAAEALLSSHAPGVLAWQAAPASRVPQLKKRKLGMSSASTPAVPPATPTCPPTAHTSMPAQSLVTPVSSAVMVPLPLQLTRDTPTGQQHHVAGCVPGAAAAPVELAVSGSNLLQLGGGGVQLCGAQGQLTPPATLAHPGPSQQQQQQQDAPGCEASLHHLGCDGRPLEPDSSGVQHSQAVRISRTLYRKPFNPPKRVSAGCVSKA